jgi:miniconductance mechanosensitive channel
LAAAVVCGFLAGMQGLVQWLVTLLGKHGVSPAVADASVRACLLLVVLLLAAAAFYLARSVAVGALKRFARSTRTLWDDHLVSAGVFDRAAHFAPLFVIHALGSLALAGTAPAAWLETAVKAYFIVVVFGVLNGLVNATQHHLATTRVGACVPLKSFAQAVNLTLYLIGGILLLSVLLGREPLYFFSGLTAVAAVLMLVFKDAILGFVAGIQISVNQTVRVGDWIEMPRQGADGEVTDVSLTTVKVQNWDKTISTIPAYALIAESFKNWRGMSESGGRRIKRALNIDMQTVCFADAAMLAKWRQISRLRPYLDAKLAEIAAEEAATGDAGTTTAAAGSAAATGNAVAAAGSVLGNGRRLTNLGTFRAYCVAYLRDNPLIHKDMTLLVRQLDPDEHGIPLEIYVFTTTTEWGAYEDIQADIFDHLLAIIPLFGLRVFQSI